MSVSLIGAMLALAVLAALWLTRPLWQAQTVEALRRRRANVIAYRSRLAEIDAEQNAGALDAEAAQALRDEAAARVLRDADAADAASAPVPRRPWWALALTLLLATLTLAAYWQSGGWRTRELIELAERDPAAAESRMLDEFLVQLQERVAEQPRDAESWAMLGRSLQLKQRYAEAASAYTQALAHAPNPVPADWLVGAGEVRALVSDDRSLAPVRALFEQALVSEPGHAKALWYAGLAAIQAGDAATAFRHWKTLREQPLPDDIAGVLDAQLPQLAARAGQNWETPASGLTLTANIRLSDALRDALQPGMRLLVFAKAENGPPMPLAVRRIEAPQLPLTVTLDDSLAMLPAMKLSGFERWVVTARLTTGAGAEALSGDLEGRHALGREQAGEPFELVIDQRRP